jgi:hypothetical protein
MAQSLHISFVSPRAAKPRPGIDGPAFKTDRAARQALRAAVYKHGASAYVIHETHWRHTATGFSVVIKRGAYEEESFGHGRTLRVAAHRALCSAGLR